MPTFPSSSFLNSTNSMPMPSITLYFLMIITLLNLFLLTAESQASAPYHPTDLILLNCGESSNKTSPDGRTWAGENLSPFLPSNAPSSKTSSASRQDPSVDPVPYMTARLIFSNFTYTFPVLPGPKFIRLHLYPETYSGFNSSSSFFSVTANGYTLLSNFSAYLTVSATTSGTTPISSFFKEFIVTVWEKEPLEITFSPSQSSFAFINAIEIVSIPSNLYSKDMSFRYPFVNSGDSFYFDNTTALETVYRLNVGGGFVASVNDSGMFRTWLDDTGFIYADNVGLVHHAPENFSIRYTNETPEYVAPPVVYRTKRTMGNNPQVNLNSNLTWNFSVDSGFSYIFRLHFCETEEFVEAYQRVFDIFINKMTAKRQLDVMQLSGGHGFPMYIDCVVFVPNLKAISGKVDLWLDLHPDIANHPTYADAILNGLEILKLNNSDGILAGPNPEPVVTSAAPEPVAIISKKTKSKRLLILFIAIGASAIALSALVFVLCFFRYQRRRKVKDHQSSVSTTTTTSLPTDLCRLFTISEMREATKNFDDQNLIGSGGFGKVYKGYVQPGSIPVAIKRLDSSSKQGMREFHTEITMLSRLRHVHLVSLIGYCQDQNEMILVYEYMPNGTLKDHLYKKDLYRSNGPPLTWKQRLQICLGTARGLHYLHTGSKNMIIHRDVKSTNILLDRNLVAKVSDFGLSKIGPTSLSQTHVSTIARGSFGYIDPEYYRRQQLSEKSDVYSFGVVMFELLCARPPVIQNLPRDQVNLVELGRNCYRRGMLDHIIDKNLKGEEVDPMSLMKFGTIADSCLREKGNERPTMADVVWGLEFALQLQETADMNKMVTVGASQLSPERKADVTIDVDDDDNLFSSSGRLLPHWNTTSETSAISTDPSGPTAGEVFSEIMYARGR